MPLEQSYAELIGYGQLDPFKIRALQAGEALDGLVAQNVSGFRAVPWSRGESFFLVEGPNAFFAHLVETLGTKIVAADIIFERTGVSHYAAVAIDAAAMILNDLATSGGQAMTMGMHLAVGDSNWLANEQRQQDLVAGWAQACREVGCTWGGGETPTLRGIVDSGTAVLDGSAMGIIMPKGRVICSVNIRPGMRIILVQGSGLHANGATDARRVADNLSQGYDTPVGETTYGELLMKPTVLYGPLVTGCLARNIPLAYAINITGHAMAKLMRAVQPFEYVVEELPAVPEIFRVIQQDRGYDDWTMHKTFNMGPGFALIVDGSYVEDVLAVAKSLQLSAYDAGEVKAAEQKRVVLEPKGRNMIYTEDDLRLR